MVTEYRAAGVAVILLNFCGASDSLACLDSLLAHGRLFDRLFICDNGSSDDSWTRLIAGVVERESAMSEARQRAALPERPLWTHTRRDTLLSDVLAREAWVVLIDNQFNLGFAAGNNVGLRLAMEDANIGHFWLLNNDTELPHGTLQALIESTVARPDIDLWGATVVYHDQPQIVQALGGGQMNAWTAETRHIGAFLHCNDLRGDASEISSIEADLDYVLGASMLVSRRWLSQVGEMSEDYFLYYEEIDWALRGKRLGLRLGYAPSAIVWHKEGATIGTAPDGGSPLSVFHLNRSRTIFIRKFFPPTLLAFSTMRASWMVVKQLMRGRLRLAIATVRGVVAGFHARAPRGE